MFGVFKKKKTRSFLAMKIESQGLEQVTNEVVAGVMNQLSGTGYLYHFILAELDGASMGNEKAKKFARDSGIEVSEYKGQHQFEHPLIDGPRGAKTILDAACLGMLDQQDLVVEFRLMVLDKLMRRVEVGKYQQDDEQFDGARFWEWVKDEDLRIKFEPAEIGEWSEITELNFSGNRLSDLPDDIMVHTGLVDLSLFDNEFSSIPNSIFSFPSLNRLNLARNKLVSLTNDIGSLKKLKTLDLGHNYIETLPENIGSLKNIEKLILNDNCLSRIPNSIGGLTHLQYLSLAGNDLRDLPEELANLRDLRIIELQGNDLSANSVKKWTEIFSDIGCEFSFGYQKSEIADPIRVVENIKGGPIDDSYLGMHLNSEDGESVTNIFRWETAEPEESDFLGSLLSGKKYAKLFVGSGLNAIDEWERIVPIRMHLTAEILSDEQELIEWSKVIYMQVCNKYGLSPNSRLHIVGISTSGDEKGLEFMEG